MTVVVFDWKTSTPYDVPSEKSKMPASPSRSGLFGNVIEIAARKSSVQIATTLIENWPGVGKVVVDVVVVLVVVVDEVAGSVVDVVEVVTTVEVGFVEAGDELVVVDATDEDV